MTSAHRAQAAAELLKRRGARVSFADWARICGFEPAKHHLLLIEKLEAVVRGDIRKLAVFMPPGSAKSTYTSQLFPPWYLGQCPQSAILTASHSADLATLFGRRARNLIQDHQQVLGYGLRKDSQAADEWTTDKGGLFFCAGVGGKIAGRRADLALIDDPIGSKEDAYSKLMRDKVWEWYKFDYKTRWKPNVRLVLVQTRWHEDDLGGRLLASEGNEWDIVNLPMVAKDDDALGRAPGELLWPDYFTAEMLAEAKKDPSVFSALYQQDPTPEDGDYFKRDYIISNGYSTRSELPSMKELTLYIASDHAVSEKETGDYTCMMVAGVDHDGVLWILPELVWERLPTDQQVEKMIDLMRRYKPAIWFAESDKIGKSIGPFLKRRMREEGVFTYIEEMRPSKDKQTRGRSIQGRLQAGMVRFPLFAPWFDAALRQLLKFPAGLHDDVVDPFAYLGLGLDMVFTGTKEKAPIDESVYFQDRPLTMGWLKDSHRQRERRRALALADN